MADALHSMYTLGCGCPQCTHAAERRVGAELCARACDAAGSLRADLEKLYTECVLVAGELRYTLLWRLSQIERAQLCLQRLASRAEEPGQGEEPERLESQINELIKRGNELAEEARLLIDAWRQSESHHPARRVPRTSGRFSRRSYVALARY